MTKLYLEPGERVTLEFSLMSTKKQVIQRIEYYTDNLNSSKNTQDVNLYTDALRIQKSKLELINKLLDKLL